MFPLLLSLSCSAIYEPIQLTDANFDTQLRKHPVTFVFVSLNTIPLCREILPKFRAVAEILKAKCQFAILESSAAPQTRDRLGLFAYPEFLVFRGSTLSAEYAGERDAAHFLDYLKRILGPNITKLSSTQETQEYIRRQKTAVFLAGTTIEPALMRKYERIAANLTDQIPFALLSTTDAMKQLNLDTTPSLVLHRHADRKDIEFLLTATTSEEDLRAWVAQTLRPKYFPHDSIIMRNVAVDPRYTFIGFVDTTKKVSMDSLHEVMDSVTDEFPTNLTYVYLDSTEMLGMMAQIGFSGAKQPVFAIIALAGGDLAERYAYPERAAATPDNLVSFVGTFLNRTGGRKIVSEMRVGGQTGPLFKIVAHDFRGVVAAADFDVVVAVMHGLADERNATMQTMQTVAEEFARQRQRFVQFTYINGDLNDLPGLQRDNWTSPVILLWPAEKEKTPFLFTGDMTPYQLMAMVKKHGKTAGAFEIPEGLEEEAAASASPTPPRDENL